MYIYIVYLFAIGSQQPSLIDHLSTSQQMKKDLWSLTVRATVPKKGLFEHGLMAVPQITTEMEKLTIFEDEDLWSQELMYLLAHLFLHTYNML